MKAQRAIIIIFFFICLKAIGAETQVVEFSPRIKQKITLADRNYFGLFPEIKNFLYADLMYDNNKGYFFSIWASETHLELKIGEKNLNELRKVVDNYEKIIDKNHNEKVNIDISLIMGLIQATTTYYSNADKVHLKMLNAKELEGKLLYLNDYELFLYTSDSLYSYKNAVGNIKSIPINEINSIKEARYPLFKGNLSVFDENRSDLKDYAMFKGDYNSYIPTPEVAKMIIKYDTVGNKRQMKKYDPELDDMYIKRYTIQATYNNYYSLIHDIPFYEFYYAKDIININKSYSYGIELGYKFKNGISISSEFYKGILSFKANNFNFIRNRVSKEDYYNSYQIGFKCSYNIYKDYEYFFKSNQIFCDAILGFDIYKLEHDNSFNYNNGDLAKNFNKLDISNNILLAYILGIKLKYKIDRFQYIVLTGYLDVINTTGSFVLFDGSGRTKNLPGFLYLFGFNAGIGFEL